VVTNARAFYTTRAAAGALGTRHSPRPHFRGEGFMHNLGRYPRRGMAEPYLDLTPLRGAQAIKQSTLSLPDEMDCFASLAMTVFGPSRLFEN
jgi:hypothetical protein